MGGYVEVNLIGDCRAVLGATDFAGVLTPKGLSSTDKGTAEAPLSIILRSGSQIQGIYGISAAKLIVYMEGARLMAKRAASGIYVVFISDRDTFEQELSAAFAADGHG